LEDEMSEEPKREEAGIDMGVWLGVALCGGVGVLMLIGWMFSGSVSL
jgi:hypothetical protein